MARRDYTYKQAKKSGNQEDWISYRKLKSLVNNKVRSAEAEHYKGIINSASDPKTLWQSLSKVISLNFIRFFPLPRRGGRGRETSEFRAL